VYQKKESEDTNGPREVGHLREIMKQKGLEKDPRLLSINEKKKARTKMSLREKRRAGPVLKSRIGGKAGQRGRMPCVPSRLVSLRSSEHNAV